MAGWSREEKLRVALQTLARLTRIPIRALEAELDASYAHDWTRDEFSLGAYSYVKVGGDVAGTYLRAPVAEKIFFAGEATIDGAARGTVHGALLSGRRAARRVRLAETTSQERRAAA
jgi:monoamine oxidase